MKETKTLGEALPEEIKRVQEIIIEYRSIPKGAGNIAATFMQHDVDMAVKSLEEGNVVDMLYYYQELKGWEL
jgi:hypothetical protein